MFHRSENLFLRPAWPEDAEAIFHGIAEEAIARNLALIPWPYRIEDARNFVAMKRDDGLPQFALTLPGEHGTPLIGLAGLQCNDGRIELGYWLGRKWWGRGYATEAARSILDIARAQGITRVHAGHFADNPASGRVLRKAGFLPTGEVRPQHSLARGKAAESIRYAIDLAGEEPTEMKRAA